MNISVCYCVWLSEVLLMRYVQGAQVQLQQHGQAYEWYKAWKRSLRGSCAANSLVAGLISPVLRGGRGLKSAAAALRGLDPRHCAACN